MSNFHIMENQLDPTRDPHTPMLNPEKTSSKLYQSMATISVCFGALCAGNLLSWSSPALLMLHPTNSSRNDTTLPPPGFTIDDKQDALVGAMLTVGALVGAVPIGYLADTLGRKKILLSLTVPFFLNWLLILSAVNVDMVIAGRFFAGIALGGICVVAPMYIVEISEVAYRGVFGSMFQMFLCSGISMTCILGSVLNWTYLNSVLLIFPLIFGMCFLFMPETPVYLMRVNKVTQAQTVLRRLRGRKFDITEEMREIQRESDKLNSNTVTLREVLTSRANLRAVIAVVGVMCFQQLNGINALVFYTGTIFEAAGTGISPSLAAIIMNLVQLTVAYISTFIIEKADRKTFLSFSTIGMTLCLATLGIYFHMKLTNLNVDHINFLPLTSVVIFMISFSLGFGPIPYLLMSELLPANIKGVASGIAVLANWISAFLVTYFFPLISSNFGEHISFYILAFIMACAVVFIHFLVPETRGKSLSEIQESLNK